MNRQIFINGGSRGIGAATVRAFAAAGDQVAFTYLQSAAAAEALAKETGAYAICADSRSSEQAIGAVEAALAHFRAHGGHGFIDVLVNCAAKAEFALMTALTDEDWRDMMACNLDGYFYYSRAVLPGMIGAKAGRIINISSMWGQVGASCEVHYSAAKAAVIGMTRALAKEVAPCGITVNCVSPGLIDTEMNRALTAEDKAALLEDIPLGRMGLPKEVAEAVLYLSCADFVTGQVLGINGGQII